MSWGDHDQEEIRKRLATFSRPSESGKADSDMEHDIKMLTLISNYELTDKHMKFIDHILTKVPEVNRSTILKNYLNGLIGSAIMDYENKYHRNRTDIKIPIWEP